MVELYILYGKLSIKMIISYEQNLLQALIKIKKNRFEQKPNHDLKLDFSLDCIGL